MRNLVVLACVGAVACACTLPADVVGISSSMSTDSSVFITRTQLCDQTLPQAQRTIFKAHDTGAFNEASGTTVTGALDNALTKLKIDNTGTTTGLQTYEANVPSSRYLYVLVSGFPAAGATTNTLAKAKFELSVQYANMEGAVFGRCSAANQEILVDPVMVVNPANYPATADAAGTAATCGATGPCYRQGTYTTGGVSTTGTWFRFLLPVWNQYPYAPVPNEDTPNHSYRRLCLKQGAATYYDTNVLLSVSRGCVTGYATSDMTVAQDGQTPATSTITAEEYQCNAVSTVLTMSDATTAALATVKSTTTGDLIVPSTANPTGWAQAFGEVPESDAQRIIQARRTACCGSRGTLEIAQTGSTTPAKIAQIMGTCIDPAAESCCGLKPYDPSFEQCCNKATTAITYVGNACPCNTANANVDCRRQGPNLLNGNDHTGATDALTGNSACCGQRMYLDGFETIAQESYCYDDVTLKCCVDGNVYDPASSQCCLVNGVQSADIPCPCGANSDCGTNQKCCKQMFPALYNEREGADRCGAWQNFPNGHADWTDMRCFGACYDTSYQMCCNGQICNSEFERCCNSTCCNKFTSSCVEGQHRPADNSANNFMNYGVYYEVCTSIEAMTARRTFFIFVMPLALLTATLLALAAVTLLARRLTDTEFDRNEQFLVVVAVALVLFAIAFYFSHAYKYGVVAAFTGIFAILASVSRSKRLRGVLVLVALINVLYMINPFGGNFFLGFTGGYAPQRAGAATQVVRDNIVEAVAVATVAPAECTGFYDFFQFDENVRDAVRLDNPSITTYGYCSRSWLTTLMSFGLVIDVLSLLLLLLAIFSFSKKMSKEEYVDPIEYE